MKKNWKFQTFLIDKNKIRINFYVRNKYSKKLINMSVNL